MLYNGFGEHNIQGIGDKHIPLIHNVMAPTWRRHLRRVHRRAQPAVQLQSGSRIPAAPPGSTRGSIDRLHMLGLSSLCNILASIKRPSTSARRGRRPFDRGHRPRPAVRHRAREDLKTAFKGSFDEVKAAEVFGRHLRATLTITTRMTPVTGTDLRPGILHLGGATGREHRRIRGSTSPRFWRGLRSHPGLGRDDRRVQRAHGCRGRRVRDRDRVSTP